MKSSISLSALTLLASAACGNVVTVTNCTYATCTAGVNAVTVNGVKAADVYTEITAHTTDQTGIGYDSITATFMAPGSGPGTLVVIPTFLLDIQSQTPLGFRYEELSLLTSTPQLGDGGLLTVCLNLSDCVYPTLHVPITLGTEFTFSTWSSAADDFAGIDYPDIYPYTDLDLRQDFTMYVLGPNGAEPLIDVPEPVAFWLVGLGAVAGAALRSRQQARDRGRVDLK